MGKDQTVMQETVLTNTKFIRERQGDIVRDTVTSYKIVNQKCGNLPR